jgi:putative ABC transport system substrate-binding protein
MKRLICAALAAAVLLAAPAAWAKNYVIAVNQFVEHPALDAVLKGFQDYLKEKGVACEYKIHNAQANMATTNQIAQTIAGENPDLVLAIATPSAQAQAQVIKKAEHMAKVPLLFSAVTDPLGAKLVADLKKPGANITGVSDLTPMDKHLGMILEFLPKLKSIGIVYNAGEANSKTLVQLLRDAAAAKGVKVEEATAAKSGDVYAAGKSLVGRCDAVYVPTDNTVVSGLESLVKVCEQNKLPLFAGDVDSVPRGCVAALGFDYYLHGKQAGAMAERILKGASPAETPVEFQEGLKLEINMKAAKAMGVTVPEAMKQKASKVIE